MKKLFEVSIPSTVLFENLDDAVGFAKLLGNAKSTTSESIYSSDSRDGRSHYLQYLKNIDLRINFSANEFLENKGEALDRMVQFKASEDEMKKRNAMTKEELESYMKEVVKNTKALDNTDYCF